jgi:hypothetical protein
MNRQKTILTGTLALVGFLFSAFGGFIGYSAPPLNPLGDGDSKLIVGIAQFAALMILLLITVLAAGSGARANRTIWTIASIVLVGVFLGSSFSYDRYRGRTSFRFPNVEGAQSYHVGRFFTTEAEAFRGSHPDLSTEQLIQEFGGFENIRSIWSEDALAAVHWRLSALYLAMMVGLSAAVFALIQLISDLTPARKASPASQAS